MRGDMVVARWVVELGAGGSNNLSDSPFAKRLDLAFLSRYLAFYFSQGASRSITLRRA